MSGKMNISKLKNLTKLLEQQEKISELKNKNLLRFFNINSVPMAIFEAKTGGVFIEVNKAFENLLDYDRDELIGKSYKEFIVQDDIYAADKMIESMIEGSKNDNEYCAESIINEYIKKNGEKVTIMWSGTGPDEDGFTYFIAKDITNENKVKKQLREYRNLLKIIERQSQDLLTLHEPDGTYKYASPSCYKILGYKENELIGKSAYDFFHPDDIKRIQETSHEKALNNEPATIRYRFQKKDGDYIWLETKTSPLLSKNGEVVELQTTSRDITLEVEKQQELNERWQIFKSIVDKQDRLLIKIFDKDGKTLYTSPSSFVITGYYPEEHVQAEGFSMIHPDDIQVCHKVLQRAIDGQESDVVLSGKSKDNGYISLQTRITPIKDGEGATKYILTIGEPKQ